MNVAGILPRHAHLWAKLAGGILLALALGLFLSRSARVPEPLNLTSGVVSDTYRPVINIPWVRYGGDFGGIAEWQIPGISHDPHTVDSWLRKLSDDGVTAVVWFLFGDGRGSLQFDNAGFVRGLAPEFLQDYRNALDILKENRMQVIWVITDFKIANPKKIERGVQTFGRADIIEDDAKANSLFEKALLPVLEDEYDRDQIAGWIVINEPEHVLRDGSVSEGAMRTFIRNAAAEIHQHRPRQPVSIGSGDLSSMIHLSDLEGLDFFVFHHWAPAMPPPASDIRTFLRGHLGRNADRKPIFIGEYNLDFPPGLNTRRFLATTKAFGYSGIWPWSLHNRVDASGNIGADVDPRFAALDPYLNVFRSSTKESGGDTDLALASVKAQILSNVNSRIAEIESADLVMEHRKHATENMEWRQRILQRDLPVFQQHLTQASNDREQALKSLGRNEAWVKRASESDMSRARAAEQTSRQWVARTEHDVLTAQDDIKREDADLRNATNLWRSHSYLSGETADELAWLRWLKSRLQEESASPNR